MPTVPAAQQRRLLDVAALDAKIAQLEHRKAHLPAAQRLADVERELDVARGAHATAQAIAGDLDREVAKAEADVEQVRTRAERNNQRLHAGVGTAKEMLALQSELEMLARRRGDLEDVLLEVMERQEAAGQEAMAAQGRLAELDEQRAALASQVDSERAALDAELADLRRSRQDATGDVDQWLMEQYERLRKRGKGAAELRAGRCGACGFELSATDVAAFRSAGPDEVLRCGECDSILVRTQDSGL